MHGLEIEMLHNNKTFTLYLYSMIYYMQERERKRMFVSNDPSSIDTH